MRTVPILMAATAVGAVVVSLSVTEARPRWAVVMRGLDNPRGLTFTRIRNNHTSHAGDDRGGWALYVAEAGKGGPGPCAMLRDQMQCAGATGAVSRYYRGRQERIVTGLPSYALSTPPPLSGVGATGPNDVSFADGKGYVAIGLGTPIRYQFGEGFGWIVRFRDDGRWFFDTDVASYEEEANPDGAIAESNPYGLLNGAGRRIVVDAAGNTLLRLQSPRRISTIAVFPSRVQERGTDAVPNSVAVGPDGAYYVGELTGAPFVPGTANVWRVVPGRAPQVYCEGFSFIIDLDFDQHGNLYVLEHTSAPYPMGAGTLYRVARNCRRTPVVTGLSNPTSVTIGPDGNAYISNRATWPAIGEVIRVDLPGRRDEEHDKERE